MNEEQQKWYDSRPEKIKRLIDKYPFGKYIVKDGAPYGISCPKTEVYMFSYREDGDVGVVVKAEDKRPEALDHEMSLGVKHHKSVEDVKEIQGKDILVHIDPKWLELIEREKD